MSPIGTTLEIIWQLHEIVTSFVEAQPKREFAADLLQRSQAHFSIQATVVADKAVGALTKMIAHGTQAGESIDQAIDWAAGELEGFMRT
jgi:hypothetical protein